MFRMGVSESIKRSKPSQHAAVRSDGEYSQGRMYLLDQADVLKAVLVALGFYGISLDIFGLENRVTL